MNKQNKFKKGDIVVAAYHSYEVLTNNGVETPTAGIINDPVHICMVEKVCGNFAITTHGYISDDTDEGYWFGEPKKFHIDNLKYPSWLNKKALFKTIKARLGINPIKSLTKNNLVALLKSGYINIHRKAKAVKKKKMTEHPELFISDKEFVMKKLDELPDCMRTDQIFSMIRFNLEMEERYSRMRLKVD